MKPEPPEPTIGVLVIVVLMGMFGVGAASGSAVDLVHVPQTQDAVVTGTSTMTSRVTNHRISFTHFRLRDGTKGSAVSNGRVEPGDTIRVHREPKTSIGWQIQGPRYLSILGVAFGLLVLGLSAWGGYVWFRARRRLLRSSREPRAVSSGHDAEREAYEAAKREDLRGEATQGRARP